MTCIHQRVYHRTCMTELRETTAGLYMIMTLGKHTHVDCLFKYIQIQSRYANRTFSMSVRLETSTHGHSE